MEDSHVTIDKTQVLIKALEKNQRSFGTDDAPEQMSDDLIERILQKRTDFDSRSREERRIELDIMFPSRITGALYEENPHTFTFTDF